MQRPDPPRPDPSEVTRLLASAGPDSSERLLALVYEDLRALAQRQVAGERGDLTLQPTALVHEAWLRLVSTGERSWEDRAHFFRTAARAMRRILVDRARRVQRDRHGGGRLRVTLGDPSAEDAGELDALAFDESLCGLEEVDGRLAEIVTLRFYAGLTVEETARALSISPRTVKREWGVARAWLSEKLETGAGGGPGA